MKEKNIPKIVDLIDQVLTCGEDEKVINDVKKKVNAMMKTFKIFAY
jgi:glycine hydroxymethyltransferase